MNPNAARRMVNHAIRKGVLLDLWSAAGAESSLRLHQMDAPPYKLTTMTTTSRLMLSGFALSAIAQKHPYRKSWVERCLAKKMDSRALLRRKSGAPIDFALKG